MVEPNPASLERALSVPDQKIAPWPRRLAAVLFILLAFAVGSVLCLYPWIGDWDTNFFAGWIPLWRNPFTRGAVTGLGLVTLSISVIELFRLGKR